MFACYCRVSTDKQSNGLQAQRRALEDYCKSRNIENYKIFEDINQSGTKSSRPQLDKLLTEVRNGEIQTVIVFSFSRFARSTKFLLDTLEEFERLKVNFISLSENVDLSSAIGRAMFTIISAIASLERDLISERVRNGLSNARAKGKQIGRPTIINYELILKLRNEGYTYKEISELLNISQGSISTAIKKHSKKP